MDTQFVYSFNEGNRSMKELLGIKGANLAEMTRIGLPVPFGFTVTTEACRRFHDDGDRIDPGLVDEIKLKLEDLESVMQKRFGDGEDPLLVSVRSGAPVHVPGVMDTILNLGLNDVTVEALARLTGNEHFAYDSYRRLIMMFGDVVLGVKRDRFKEIFAEMKAAAGVGKEGELSADDLKEVCMEFRKLIKDETGKVFPQDPFDQLTAAIAAVFKSWWGEKAQVYRRQKEIPASMGTAVNIQSMVFGNKGDNSCTGVAFTRNPMNGDKEIYGAFLVNAQGGDFAKGDRPPKPIAGMSEVFPQAYKSFVHVCEVLEKHYKDMQEMEFAIEEGRLYMLQTRNGKRTAHADIRIAMDMVSEELIDRRTAVLRIEPKHIDQLMQSGSYRSPELAADFKKIMSWADEFRTMRVRANADTPEEAELAVKFGAEGIGLCRTEHMFFDENRIHIFREMIIASTEEERKAALIKLLPFQQSDFAAMYRSLGEMPMTVRLLDPPLHEFLPKTDEEAELLAKDTGVSVEEIKAHAEELKEFNMMLGHRGLRLAVTHPEIAEMQTEAVFAAACEVSEELGTEIVPEIMIPLSQSRKELAFVKNIVVTTAERVMAEKGKKLDYTIGTMIEVPRAAVTADELARESEFFSFGTNDLTQMTLGFSREDTAGLVRTYIEKGIIEADPFKTIDLKGVGALMKTAVELGKKARPEIKLGICGEHGGDPKSVEFFNGIGLHYVSCKPYRVPVARLAAAQAAIRKSMKETNGFSAQE